MVQRVPQQQPLTHFAEVRADVAVVEVGLGGVRDATNVFSDDNLVEAAVVTTLDLEHLAALGGDSIAHVAAAKAHTQVGACAGAGARARLRGCVVHTR